MSQTLEGSVERITFYNEDNGYTVARFQPKGKDYIVTVVGNLMSVQVGEFLRLQGQWTTHPQHGRQFTVERYSVELPATVEGVRKYLGSGLIKGVGPVTAERIVEHFGIEALDVIEQQPDRLNEVPGVGPKRVVMIQRAWAEQQQIKEVMLFLQSHGVSPTLAVKIYKEYGDAAISVVKNEPYRLAKDIYGIGFLTADKIAQALGIGPEDPQRMAAGVRHVLAQFSDDGHVFALRPDLVREAANILGVALDKVAWAIEQLALDDEIKVEDEAVYLRPFYYGEVGVANRLLSLLATPASRLAVYADANWERVFNFLNSQTDQPLTHQQQESIRMALTHKVAILTGGPGTGKTTTLKTLIRLLKAKKRSFLLAAPTGRAAKRLSEATVEPAQTLHRLLEFAPHKGMKFLRDKDNPLDADMVIVDEVSMMDLLLTNALLKALDVTSHLLLVGDVDQLPSVGAGNVLRDLIASDAIPVVHLDTIFRQAADSLIIVNAHRINRGEMPQFSRSARDFFLFNQPDPPAAADLVVDIIQNRIPAKFGLDSTEDIQVLSPMHRGPAGVGELNRRLQEALNPPAEKKPEIRLGGRVFRVGDKVLQVRNNYDKKVFNGDLGRVTRIDLEDQVLTAVIDGLSVEYEFSQLDELVHAFAMSVHKSQGGEFLAVVIPLLTQHYMLLQRNLLYTAVTRAKRLVVLVGSKQAIAIAVRNDKIAARNSRLAERLQAPVPAGAVDVYRVSGP